MESSSHAIIPSYDEANVPLNDKEAVKMELLFTNPKYLAAPTGLLVDEENDKIYVANADNHTILEVNIEENSSKILVGETKRNGNQDSSNLLNGPRGFCQSRIRPTVFYIADYWNNCIKEFDDSRPEGFKMSTVVGHEAGNTAPESEPPTSVPNSNFFPISKNGNKPALIQIEGPKEASGDSSISNPNIESQSNENSNTSSFTTISSSKSDRISSPVDPLIGKHANSVRLRWPRHVALNESESLILVADCRNCRVFMISTYDWLIEANIDIFTGGTDIPYWTCFDQLDESYVWCSTKTSLLKVNLNSLMYMKSKPPGCHLDPQEDSNPLISPDSKSKSDKHENHLYKDHEMIQTICGNRRDKTGYADGPSHSARFNWLSSCIIMYYPDDWNHNMIYISDFVNHRIRRYDSKSDSVTTVVGSGAHTCTAGSALTSGLAWPLSIQWRGETMLATSHFGHCLCAITGLIKLPPLLPDQRENLWCLEATLTSNRTYFVI